MSRLQRHGTGGAASTGTTGTGTGTGEAGDRLESCMSLKRCTTEWSGRDEDLRASSLHLRASSLHDDREHDH
jgi:hypothetical protein